MISETKLDSSFPRGHFLINSYSEPFRIDRNSQRYLRKDIPSKVLGVETSPTEDLDVEITLTKKTWLLCCSYKPNKTTFSFTWKT